MDDSSCQSLFKPIVINDENRLSPNEGQTSQQHADMFSNRSGSDAFGFVGSSGADNDDDYDYSSLYFEAIDLCMPLVNDLGAAFPTYNSNSQDGQVQRCNSVPVHLFYFNGGGGETSSASDLIVNQESTCTTNSDSTSVFDNNHMNSMIDSSGLLVDSTIDHQNSSLVQPLTQPASDILPIYLPNLVMNTPPAFNNSDTLNGSNYPVISSSSKLPIISKRTPVKSASLDLSHSHDLAEIEQGIDLKPLLQNYYTVGYTCLARACGLDFASKAEILAHIKEKHWIEIPEDSEEFNEHAKLSYKCVYLKHQSKVPCGKKLDSLNKIANHICKEHPLRRILQPIISNPVLLLNPTASSAANISYSYSPSLIAALNETSGRLKKIHICPHEECLMLYFSESAFKSHKSLHVEPPFSDSISKKKYLCSICNSTFARPSHLTTHMKLHENEEMRFKCDYCNETFLKQSLLLSHISREHKKNDKLFKCPYDGCKKEYSCKMYLDSHISKQHMKPVNEDDRHCSICNKDFQASWLKRQHEEFKHFNNPQFKCLYEGCDKKFESSSKLQRHSRVHLKIKNFKCHFENCGAEFTRNEHLIAHLGGVHDCKSSFRYYNNLLTHKKTAHSAKKDHTELDEKISRLIMTNELIEPNPLESSSNVLVHMPTSSGVVHQTEPDIISCNYCGVKFFEQNENYQMHLKTHFDIEKASEKLNNYLIAISNEKSNAKSDGGLMEMPSGSTHHYSANMLIGSATTNDYSDPRIDVPMNPQSAPAPDIYFYTTNPTTTTTTTTTTSIPSDCLHSSIEFGDQPNEIDHQSSCMSTSSASSAADIEITQFINEMTDNLTGGDTNSVGQIESVVESGGRDFISSFLNSNTGASHDANNIAADVFNPTHVSQIHEEPLINIQSDDEEIIACSGSAILESLSGSARTDYKSNHTYIEKNFLKRRQKDFMSMSVNNLTFCNLSAVKKHKAVDDEFVHSSKSTSPISSSGTMMSSYSSASPPVSSSSSSILSPTSLYVKSTLKSSIQQNSLNRSLMLAQQYQQFNQLPNPSGTHMSTASTPPKRRNNSDGCGSDFHSRPRIDLIGATQSVDDSCFNIVNCDFQFSDFY